MFERSGCKLCTEESNRRREKAKRRDFGESKRTRSVGKWNNYFDRREALFRRSQPGTMANKAKSSAALSAEPTINHSRLFPQIHLATSASGSFSEGGQYVVRRRIDCLGGFTMKRREERTKGTGEEPRAKARETTTAS